MAWVVTFVSLCLVVAGWAFWYSTVRQVVEGGFRPSLHLRVEKILSPYEGEAAPADLLAELQRRVDEAVRDTLVDLHRGDDDITVIVKNDELLGPVCFIQTPNGELSLADFERRLGS